MGTDFFDDDLAPAEAAVKKEKAKADEPQPETAAPAPLPVRPSAEAGHIRMARQRQEAANQMAGAATEIERLRMRQEQLEQEKRALEDLARKQSDYTQGKQEMIEKLEKGVILAEKEEQQAAQMAELLAGTRGRFKEILAELRNIREEAWSEQDFAVDLNKALVLVEDARRVYKQSLAKLNAAHWEGGAQRAGQPSAFEEAVAEVAPARGFSHWLVIGLAVSLPLLAVHVILFVLWFVLARSV